MDTTPQHGDDIDRVSELLSSIEGLDPADAVAPLARAAEILESLLEAHEEAP